MNKKCKTHTHVTNSKVQTTYPSHAHTHLVSEKAHDSEAYTGIR